MQVCKPIQLWGLDQYMQTRMWLCDRLYQQSIILPWGYIGTAASYLWKNENSTKAAHLRSGLSLTSSERTTMLTQLARHFVCNGSWQPFLARIQRWRRKFGGHFCESSRLQLRSGWIRSEMVPASAWLPRLCHLSCDFQTFLIRRSGDLARNFVTMIEHGVPVLESVYMSCGNFIY